ncbi:MAG: tRNA pseudouridine(38-40) synthase TruA [Oligoflexales bacterium]
MSSWRLDLSYIGHHYSGWQSQSDGNAIQDHMQKALKILLREDVKVQGASRTDTGVHAQQQVAVFHTHKDVDPYRMLPSLNALLPDGVAVRSIRETEIDFHPAFRAKAKVYRYRLWKGRCHEAFYQPWVWSMPFEVDVEGLKKEAQHCVGRYDFTSFCNRDSTAKTRTRTVLDIHIEDCGPLVNVWVLGEGFLKQMVRILVGTLVDRCRGHLKTEIPYILEQKDRRQAGVTAPACGLSLVELYYDDIATIADVIERQKQGLTMSVP